MMFNKDIIMNLLIHLVAINKYKIDLYQLKYIYYYLSFVRFKCLKNKFDFINVNNFYLNQSFHLNSFIKNIYLIKNFNKY